MRKIGIIILFSVLAISCNETFPDRADQRLEYLGKYEVYEYSNSLEVSTNFNIEIKRDYGGSNTVKIYNFYDTRNTIIAEIYGSKIKIPIQQIGFYEFEGYGTFYGDHLALYYSVKDTDSETELKDYCNANCTKKIQFRN
jgi:hypothetical protein